MLVELALIEAGLIARTRKLIFRVLGELVNAFFSYEYLMMLQIGKEVYMKQGFYNWWC
jgi:hypothetical protein